MHVARGAGLFNRLIGVSIVASRKTLRPALRSPTTRLVRVLSIRQPWVDLIFAGPRFQLWKWCENREWKTNYRGELYIHASRLDALPADAPIEVREMFDAPGKRIVGAIVGCVELLTCIHAGELEDVFWKLQKQSQRRMNDEQNRLMELLRDVPEPSWDHVSGTFCFVLWNPRKLKVPIPTGGKLGIWKFDLPLSAK
jgi:hypothetical protein